MSRIKITWKEYKERARQPKPKHGSAEYQRWRIACVKTNRETKYCRIGEVARRREKYE